MYLTLPKRLFHVPSMSTVMYENVVDDVKDKGYVAVSHVWGNQEMFTAAKLGINSGVEWKIPLSNSNKISRLKNAMNYYNKEYCWFDVLCMPQDKQDLINLEIPFMGDYYKGANITFILSTINYNVSDNFTEWCSFMSDVIEKKREFTSEENKWFTNNKNILDLSKEIWLTRVWTLQEAVLSNKLIFIGLNASRLNLSDVLDGITHLENVNSTYSLLSFSKSYNLIQLSRAIETRKVGQCTSIEALSYNTERKCDRILDRFYGVLGILGYRDFVVDYEIPIEDLNKKFAQYAYSKGDVSWMSVGGDLGYGFVQPMYESFHNIGTGWTDIWPHSSDILFDDNTMTMSTSLLGRVTHKAKFTESNLKPNEFIGWCVRTFREWEFDDDDDICAAMEGFRTYPDTNRQVVKIYLDGLSKCKDLGDMGMEMAELFGSETATTNMFAMFSVMSDTNLLFRSATLIKVNEHALIVCGNADCGDRVVLAKIVDKDSRLLGIVISNTGKRKGICLCSRQRMHDLLTAPLVSHTFLL